MTNELKDQSCVEGPLCALGWVWPLGLSLKSTGTVGLPSRIYKLLNNKTHVKSLITTQDMGETPSADSLRFMPSHGPVPNVTGAETAESPGGCVAPTCICGDRKGTRMLATMYEHFMNVIPNPYNNSARMNSRLLHHNFLRFSPEEKAREVK